MTEHTPGPWSYCQESVDPEWWIVTIKGGSVVANVNANCHQEENARLIAAAPDMLEALKSAVAFLEQLVRLNRIPANIKGLRDARAAIAKATADQYTIGGSNV